MLFFVCGSLYKILTEFDVKFELTSLEKYDIIITVAKGDRGTKKSHRKNFEEIFALIDYKGQN